MVGKGWNRVKHHGKTAGKWVWRGIAAVLFLLGLGQIPDETTVWERWLAAVRADPRVHALAVTMAHIGGFLDLWWVRACLILAAAAIVFWGSRPFWRARSQAIFLVRHALAERVWISEEAALTVIRQSRWARTRRRAADPSRSKLADTWGMASFNDDPAKEVRDARFSRWCEKALEAFGETEREAVREAEGKREYDEVQLKAYLTERFDSDVIDEFGAPR